ncbi:MAG: YlxR family protein [Thermoleophilia bacterium]
MVNRGHVPQRMCIGCGQRAAKSRLVRFTKSDLAVEGRVRLDPDGSGPGRGVYLCPRLECYDKATGKRRSLQRKLGAAVIEPELRAEFTRLIGD